MDSLIFVSRSSILDFTSSLGHVYPFFRDHKYERYFKLGCDSVFSNRRYSMSWRTSISGSLTLGQGSRRHLSRRSVRISSNWADPALWKEGRAKKSKDSHSRKLFMLPQSITPGNSRPGNQDEGIRQSTLETRSQVCTWGLPWHSWSGFN